jgi:hypothetical protein
MCLQVVTFVSTPCEYSEYLPPARHVQGVAGAIRRSRVVDRPITDGSRTASAEYSEHPCGVPTRQHTLRPTPFGAVRVGPIVASKYSDGTVGCTSTRGQPQQPVQRSVRSWRVLQTCHVAIDPLTREGQCEGASARHAACALGRSSSKRGRSANGTWSSGQVAFAYKYSVASCVFHVASCALRMRVAHEASTHGRPTAEYRSGSLRVPQTSTAPLCSYLIGLSVGT